jgi:hypothetical protein
MGPREVKGDKLKLARQIAERHLAEFTKETGKPSIDRLKILAARKMEKASGLLYSDCLKFINQGRW